MNGVYPSSIGNKNHSTEEREEDSQKVFEVFKLDHVSPGGGDKGLRKIFLLTLTLTPVHPKQTGTPTVLLKSFESTLSFFLPLLSPHKSHTRGFSRTQ